MINALPPFYQMPWTESNGRMTSQSVMFNDQVYITLSQLITVVNSITGSDGLTPPNLTTAQITAIFNNAKSGTIWLNTDLNQWQGKDNAGVLKTFTVT